MILLKFICIYLLIGSLIALWGAIRTSYKYKLITYLLVMLTWPFAYAKIFILRWQLRQIKKANENLTKLLKLIKEKDTVALQKWNDTIIKKEKIK